MAIGSTWSGESDSMGRMSKTFRPWDVEQQWPVDPVPYGLALGRFKSVR